jgi:hypothetical protein
MLGSTAICSTVSLVGFSPGSPSRLSPLKFNRRLPAGFAAEGLRGMTGREITIARLPQALAGQRIELRDLRSFWQMIRIGSGQAGGCPVSQVSLAKLVTSQRGDFSKLKTPFYSNQPPRNLRSANRKHPSHPAKLADS